jgi:competence protein ComFC
MLRAVTDSVLSLAFPQECHVCSGAVDNHSDGVACGKCWANTKLFTGNEMLCNKCGAFFSDTAAPVDVYCHKCDNHAYDKAVALGVYESGLSATILELKRVPNVPRHLADLIRDAAPSIPAADIIVPVPLSKMRAVERGHNQAALIAECVSRNCRVPLDLLSLQRRKHTPIHRMGMDQRARELTVEKAFDVVRPNLVKGKAVLLVDDVLTSGSTASACAKALIRNGSSRVSVFTLARAVMH